MLHIIVECYFSTPNLIYTPLLKAQALNMTSFLKAQALNLTLFLKAQALNLALFLTAQALNLVPFLKAQALNLALILKAQALNLALLSKAQALNLALTSFTYPTFKHKLSKGSKYQTNQQFYQSKNYVTLILHPWWRYVGARSNLVGLPKTKKIFCLFYLNLFLGKINILKKSHSFTCLIKGTALGRRCGVLVPSSHVTDSRTLNMVLRTCLILFSVFHSFSLINYGGDSSVLLKLKNCFYSPSPSWPWLWHFRKEKNYNININLMNATGGVYGFLLTLVYFFILMSKMGKKNILFTKMSKFC